MKTHPLTKYLLYISFFQDKKGNKKSSRFKAALQGRLPHPPNRDPLPQFN